MKSPTTSSYERSSAFVSDGHPRRRARRCWRESGIDPRPYLPIGSGLATSLEPRQSALVTEPEYLLRCECGHVYDIRDRERGEFHFRVLKVDKELDDHGGLRVIRNLRGGEVPAGKSCGLSVVTALSLPSSGGWSARPQAMLRGRKASVR